MSEASVFSASGLPPREQVSEWVNIKKNVGDKVHGIFMGWWISPARQEGFKDQIGIAIKQGDKVVGVSVGDTPYMRDRVQGSLPGDEVGLKYEGDKDTGKLQPAKIVKFYNPAMEERRKKGTLTASQPEVLAAPANVTGSDDEDPGF